MPFFGSDMLVPINCVDCTNTTTTQASHANIPVVEDLDLVRKDVVKASHMREIHKEGVHLQHLQLSHFVNIDLHERLNEIRVAEYMYDRG